MYKKLLFLFSIVIFLAACQSKPKSFWVVYNENGGEEIIDVYTTINELVLPNDPIKEGHTFSGWYFDNESFIQPFHFNLLSSKIVDETITLHAKWKLNQYTIEFEMFDDRGGNTYLKRDYGSIFTEPQIPYKNGYTFDGWYEDEEFLYPYTFTTVPAKNFTLYAKWNPLKVTISFDERGGSEVDNIVGYFSDLVSEPLAPIREGYVFNGWEKDEINRFVPYEFPNKLYVDLTLYAMWEPIHYWIDYILDGGEKLNNPDNYTIEDYLELSDASKEGYVFNGWYDNEALIGDRITYIDSGHVGDITLYAKWTIDQFTISYVIYDTYDTIRDIPLLPDEYIINASAGDSHSVVLTSEGRILTWGYNGSGQLGFITEYSYFDHPYDITFLFDLSEDEKIILLSVKDEVNLATTSAGRIFIWGESNLGLNLNPYDITALLDLNEGEIINQIYINNSYLMALTSDNRVLLLDTYIYTSIADITNDLNLEMNEVVDQISLGFKHFAVLTSNHRILMWGYNVAGQLGNNTFSYESLPIDITPNFMIDSDDYIVDLQLGMYHSIALSKKGILYTWGYSGKGLIGEPETSTLTPQKMTSSLSLTLNEHIESISASYNFSSVVTSNQRVLVWSGSGCKRDMIPVVFTSGFNLINNEKIYPIRTGREHFITLTSLNRVFIWGDADYGKIGNYTVGYIQYPTELKFVKSHIWNGSEQDYQSIISPLYPQHDELTFDGWYMDERLTIPFNLTLMPATNLILYGKWD